MIDGIGAVEQGGVAGNAAHLRHLRVDGVEPVLVPVPLPQQRVEEEPALHAVRSLARRDADDGDGAGVEDRVQRVIVARDGGFGVVALVGAERADGDGSFRL